MKIRDVIGPAAAIVAPYLLFEYLKAHPNLDILLSLPRGHFYIVSLVAILSTIIAIAVGISGNRVRNIKVCFLSLAFISLAEVFSVHGLSTPNFLIHASHLPGVASQVSLLLATFWLWMSSLSSDSLLILWLSRWKGNLIPVWTVVLGLIGITGLLFPHMLDLIPLDRNPLRWVATGVIVVLNSMTMYRYFQSYRFSRFPLQTAIIYSCGWLIVAQFIIVLGETWRLSWWLYHLLLLASMIVMLAGLWKQYGVSRSLTMSVRALFTNDPLERITSCLSPSVRALVLATEVKDTYTAGHNLRVTLYALRLGEEMQLSPEQLRALSQGTIVHDVGKINIPDAILNKPGRLTPDERAIIEQHPRKGYEMCRTLGFMKEELEIIRSHHEKWDGTGYPDRLKGEQIPLLARIVAVSDVYDALTSTRSYRKAWTHTEAIDFLNEHSNTHFDSACVDAWKRICDRDPQVYRYPLHMISDNKSNYLRPAASEDANVS
ncbi:HD-GYP domain-containing protein [Paenibacillus radicis (ex Xue et al. 2023)]|uniref:HD-GYP domain-containing protein n=1 Tax=Paenibacillus radicis (ex Xue et al. 2023) TaxID=2972489 RepID=A0ABT1YKN7_9BACL|nr:HD-GYP domain-containing protein [Paenibacillus radicis (ex Xue et al. 2023)]MCR8633746.1 HD-GYP domain-containing protein [Paenibacillus radicis (ex Xue et al. 2023)]